jgi:serine/threonine protein kinase
MDYLEGNSVTKLLSQYQQKKGCLPVEQALSIILPILEALEVIHEQQIYHRDISSQNIILTEGKPVLIDFGAARHVIGEHSRTLDLVLKHGYSPLEQYSGKGKIGPWTDIYACGALLYQLLTGILPPAATDRFCEDTLQPLLTIKGLTISPTLNQAVMGA